MEGNLVRKAFAFVAVATLVVTAGSANAQITKEDAGCRATVQKNAQKLGATAMKTIDGCIKSVLGAKLPSTTNCNSIAVADSKAKVSGAVAKLGPAIDKKCTLALNPALIATSYPNCPSPADGADAAGASTGVDTFTELSACQADINTDGIETLRRYILNPNAAAIIADTVNAKAMTACANAIAKGATGLWSTTSKERGKCQATSDKALGPYAYACSTYDAGLKIAGSTTKLNDGIDKSCTGLTAGQLGLIGTCDNSLAGIKSCVATAAKKNASGATAAAFEFDGVCPSTVRVGVNAGTGPGTTPGAHLNSTFLDAGWTGFGHDSDVVDGFVARVNLSCSNDDCSSCTVTSNCAEGNCRCSHDASIVCSTPFVAGGPCGANTCEVHFGPPLALAAGGVATCVTNIIKTELVGTADAGTGESTTAVDDTAKVHLGIDQLTPCPTCSGASIGAAGTCAGGARTGLACTTNAVNPTYGNVSYDCPPSLANNVTGAGLKIALTLTDGAVSLPFGDTCDSPLGAFSCACGACSLDPTKPCKVDGDCTGFGTCNAAGGPPRQPNGCSDLTCNADGAGTGEGTCNAGPDDKFCDGATKGDGSGYVTCSTNGDCTAPVGGGTCSLSKQRECYLNPITADGVAGIDGAELVTAFCSAPTSSGSVNAAGGLPGAGRVRLDFDFNGLCSDGVTAFELGGSNCP